MSHDQTPEENTATSKELMGSLNVEDTERVQRIGSALVAVLDSHVPDENDKMIAIAVVTLLRNAVYNRWGFQGVTIVPFVVPDGPPKEGE